MRESDLEYYIIHKFMIEKLKLKGGALNVYAIIYGYSRQGNGAYFGNRRYLSNLTGLSIRNVQNILNDLVQKGFLDKQESDEKIFYSCNLERINSEIISPPSEITSPGECKNFTPIYNNIKSNYKENINNINNKLNLYEYLDIAIDDHLMRDWFTKATYKFVILNDGQVNMLCTSMSYFFVDEKLKLLIDRQIKFYNLQFKTELQENVNIQIVPALNEKTITAFNHGARWEYINNEFVLVNKGVANACGRNSA